jgi:hypothetical protein
MTTNQKLLLNRIRAETEINGALSQGHRCRDGNERRTVRSLIRLGYCQWWPRNTHQEVLITEAGREAVNEG